MKLRIVSAAPCCDLDLTPGTEVELGRQTEAELKECQGPFTVHRDNGGTPRRVVIAWNSESSRVSRRHVRLKVLPGGLVELTNLSETFEVPAPGAGSPLRHGESTLLAPPFTVAVAERTLSVQPVGDHSLGLFRLAEQSLAPGASLPQSVGLRAPPALSGSQFDQLIEWLQATMGVLQQAVGSTDFLGRAAEALVAIVGLKSGLVLLRREGCWDSSPTITHPCVGAAASLRPSARVLETLLAERRTVWEHPVRPQGSLAGMEVVVAAPLLDAAGEVVGVLYGELPETDAADHTGIGLPARLQAALVEMLACGVSAGLARQRQEREAARAQALFGQFFSDTLARQLRHRPDMLKGRKATVTVLFGDIRGYSAVAGQLGPEKTEAWLHDVLGTLSACVLNEDGVLVDYIGDELMAMWGAPEDQPDQTERAARAALAMLGALTDLNARWREALGGDMDLGIGINRGEALVGNCGSEHKFKYGALGDTVNVGSRVQGMTKYLKCRLLVTRSAREHLGSGYDARRVVTAELVNIKDPVDLYEVAAAGDQRVAFFRASEEALDLLEKAEFARAGRQAGALLEDLENQRDGPLILTLSRATEALVRDGHGFSRVWRPPGK